MDTDASQSTVGAVISQDFPDGCHPITYFLKLLSLAEQNYIIYDWELLAIIYAVKAFHYLLLGAQQKFLIRSNHENLKYFKSPQKISTKQARWHEFLQDYNFKLLCFPGKSNTIANLLSQRKDFKGGVNPNESITLLPDHLFICHIYLEDDPDLHHKVLYEIHDTPAGGYPEISNTWELVKQR